jgi:hypothetical protein
VDSDAKCNANKCSGSPGKGRIFLSTLPLCRIPEMRMRLSGGEEKIDTVQSAPGVALRVGIHGAPRVEHVFGDQKNGMGAKLVRTIGIVRARCKIGMTNLVYNMRRFVCLATMADD